MRPRLHCGLLALLLCACRSHDPQPHATKAAAALAHEDYGTAANELVTALKYNPRQAATALDLADIALRLGNPQLAAAALAQAIKLGAPRPPIAALRVRIDLASSQANLALRDAADPAIAPLARALAQGRAYAQLSRYGEEAQAYRTALGIGPTCTEAQLGVAHTLLEQGQLQQALRATDAVLVGAPHLPGAWRVRAAILSQQGSWPAAEESLEKADSYRHGNLDLTDTMVLLGTLAEAQLKLGNIPAARKTYAELAAIAARSPMARLVGGEISLATGDLTDAAGRLQALVDQLPSMPQGHLALGRALLAQGELERSEQEFDFVVKRAPDNIEARKLLAIVRLQMGSPLAARALLEPLGHTASLDNEAEQILATAEFSSGDIAGALARMGRLAQANPQDLTLQLQLVSGYLASGADSEAAARIEELTSAHGQDVAALNAIANFALERGEFESAEPVLTQALRADPQNHQTLLTQARLSLARGDSVRARQQLEDLRRAGPAVPERLLLAQLDLREGRTADAATVIAQIPLREPGKAAQLRTIGRMWLDFAQFSTAEQDFKAALALTPGDANLWVDLAAAQVGLNQPKFAKASVGKALALDPKSLAATRALAYIQLHSPMPEEALATAHAATQTAPYAAGSWELAGDVLLERKDYAGAVYNFDRANHLGPSAALAIKTFEARSRGNLGAAFDPLQAWLKSHPGDVLVRRTLAQAYAADGRAADAAFEHKVMLQRGVRDP